MNAWPGSRTPRERAALGIALFVAAVSVVFVLLTEPGAAHLQRSRARLEGALAAHEHVAAIARQVDAIGPSRAASAGAGLPQETLMSVIDASAQAAGITGAVKRLAPAAGDEVGVVLEAVAFDALMGWLVGLHADHGLSVGQFTANPGTRTGSVNVTLVLSR